MQKNSEKFKTIEKIKKMLKKVIQVILLAAILVVAYLVIESVKKPLSFEAVRKIRYDATVQRLKDIRTAQVAFRSEHKRYTGSFDTLIEFLKTDSFTVVKQIGDADDSVAVASGGIIRETFRLSVLDSLFKKGYPVDSLRYAPFTKGFEFELGTANLTAGNVTVNVFEAKVPFIVLLDGLDPQLLVNYNAKWVVRDREGYPGLRVGSLIETTNNAGNWE